MKVQIGDLVAIPILTARNFEGNKMLAESFVPVACEDEAICEVAGFTTSKQDFLNVFLLVPKDTGWKLDIEQQKKLDASGFKINELEKSKLLQHNGWWINDGAIARKIEGTW